MSLLRMLIRVVFLGLALWFIGRLLGLVRGPSAGRARTAAQGGVNSGAGQPRSPERLVRDPWCGVALPVSRALSAGGEHFCSEACRKAFEAQAALSRRPEDIAPQRDVREKS